MAPRSSTSGCALGPSSPDAEESRSGSDRPRPRLRRHPRLDRAAVPHRRRRRPELISWKWQVNECGGLAWLDYTQNVINKTLVAPYSPRPAPGARVSAPIDWDELDEPTVTPDAFTLRSVMGRLEKGDLFRDVLDHPQRLPRLA